MTDRVRLDDLTDDDLDQLYGQLDALRTVARGYCPACGRGDAAPTVTDWEQQKQRADQADGTVGRVTGLHEEWVKAGPPPLGVPLARWWDRRLAELHDAIVPPGDEPARTTPNNPATSKESP